MKYKIILETSLYPELFVKSIRFLEQIEKIKIKENRIITFSNETSKLRANINLILRCLKIHEELIKWYAQSADLIT